MIYREILCDRSDFIFIYFVRARRDSIDAIRVRLYSVCPPTLRQPVEREREREGGKQRGRSNERTHTHAEPLRKKKGEETRAEMVRRGTEDQTLFRLRKAQLGNQGIVSFFIYL